MQAKETVASERNVKDIMSKGLACCTPDTSLKKVAEMMVNADCGAIPVVDDRHTAKPIGIVTDRDIVCRAVAMDKNPLEMSARDCMTTPVMAVKPSMSVHECCQLMEQNKIRRAVVVDEQGACIGVVAQADIAEYAPGHETAELLQAVSEKAVASSNVGPVRAIYEI